MSEWTTDFDSIDESRLHWVTFKSGNVTVLSGHAAKSSNAMQGGVVAAMPMDKPAPYQPPKPKRREWWMNCFREGRNDVPYETREQADRYAGASRAMVAFVRQVLPGDPDPDEAIELKRRCEEVADALKAWSEVPALQHSNVKNLAADLKYLAAKLRGETEAKQC